MACLELNLTRHPMESNVSMNLQRLVCLSIVCFSLLNSHANAQWHYFESSAFTTTTQIVFWHASKDVAQKLNHDIEEEFKRIDLKFSRYKADSEVSTINQAAAHQSVPISAEFFKLIQTAQQVSELSDGAFDITFASVGHHYNFRQHVQPTKAQFNLAGTIRYSDLQLHSKPLSLRKSKDNLVIDLGGIAKGYAIDQAIRILQTAGVESAHISAGGDMRLLGDKQGQPWIIAVKDPRSDAKHAVKLPLTNTAMSTSGDYERYFIDESGERVHHILSPTTGKPVRGIQSVSVIGPDATTTDALSTSVFVMGLSKGLALIESLPGIEVIIIDANRKMHFSQGLMPPES